MPSSVLYVKTYNLGQIKMERQNPVNRQIKEDGAARRAKVLHFPIFDFGEGGRGSRFSIHFVQDCRLSQA